MYYLYHYSTVVQGNVISRGTDLIFAKRPQNYVETLLHFRISVETVRCVPEVRPYPVTQLQGTRTNRNLSTELRQCIKYTKRIFTSFDKLRSVTLVLIVIRFTSVILGVC